MMVSNRTSLVDAPAKKLTITIEEMAEELGVSYPQACKLFNRIKQTYGLTDDRLPKRGCMFRKYYLQYYGIEEDDYRGI